MIRLGALLIGALIAVMIQMNGTLGEYTNIYFSGFFAHGVGTIGVLIMLIFIKENKNKEIKIPIYYYLGGILGALIIILNNISFQGLGVSTTVALILLGQVGASLMIDSWGLMNMNKVHFNKKKMLGLILITVGITVMMVF